MKSAPYVNLRVWLLNYYYRPKPRKPNARDLMLSEGQQASKDRWAIEDKINGLPLLLRSGAYVDEDGYIRVSRLDTGYVTSERHVRYLQSAMIKARLDYDVARAKWQAAKARRMYDLADGPTKFKMNRKPTTMGGRRLW